MVRMNFHSESEVSLLILVSTPRSQLLTSAIITNHDLQAAINRQINLELYASYVYFSMVREHS